MCFRKGEDPDKLKTSGGLSAMAVSALDVVVALSDTAKLTPILRQAVLLN